MSDVKFDSERAMEREEKKKGFRRLLIPLGVLVLLIIIVVAVALIIRANRTEKFTGGENTPYPYSWYIQKDGSLKFSIDHSAVADSSWSFKESDDSSLMSIEKDEKQKDPKATSFTIKPLEVGRALQTFELKSGADESVSICDLMLFTEVVKQEEAFSTEFLGASVKEAPQQINGGDNDYRYTITPEDGRIIVDIVYGQAEDGSSGSGQASTAEAPSPDDLFWQCTFDNDAISVERVRTYNSRFVVNIVPGEVPGTAKLAVRNDYLGAEVDITCSVWESGEIKVDSHEIKRFEPVRPTETDLTETIDRLLEQNVDNTENSGN